MLSILDLTKTHKLILATFAFLAVLAFGSGRAHAATLNVTGGCTLPIAINSVNAGANQSGCTAVVSPNGYGTNDTITIPAGTQTLTADLPIITESVAIKGAGMDQTIINGGSGNYTGIQAIIGDSDPLIDVNIQDLKVTAFDGRPIRAKNVNTVLKNIEVDGTGGGADQRGVALNGGSTDTISMDVENLYIHGFDTTSFLDVLSIEVEGGAGGTMNVNLKNVTIADIHNTGAGNFTYGIKVLVLGGGVINSTITNTTIHDFTGDDFTAPFGSFAAGVGGDATVSTAVKSITITGLRGALGTAAAAGIKSAAFYAASAVDQPSDSANATVTVTNSLMADNLNDGVSSNCTVADLTSAIGGSGTDGTQVITSNGYNISDDDSCVGFNQPGDQQNVSNIISTLGPLQNNGGVVPTRALLAGSPAISAGGAVLGVTTDARGVARPSTCPSVGAFQFEGAVCGASTTNAGTNAGAPNTGIGAVSPAMTIIATSLGLGITAYALRKRNAVK